MRSEGLDIQRAVGHTTKLLGFHAVGRRGRSRGLFDFRRGRPTGKSVQTARLPIAKVAEHLAVGLHLAAALLGVCKWPSTQR